MSNDIITPQFMGTATLRVTYGWSCYQDFDNATDALAFFGERLAETTHDPALRRVAVLDLDPQKYAENGYFAPIIEGQRELQR